MTNESIMLFITVLNLGILLYIAGTVNSIGQATIAHSERMGVIAREAGKLEGVAQEVAVAAVMAEGMRRGREQQTLHDKDGTPIPVEDNRVAVASERVAAATERVATSTEKKNAE